MVVTVSKDLGITRTLARFASDLEFIDLPAEVVERTKYLCLDFAGVALNGSTTMSAEAALETFKSTPRPGSSVVIGTSHRLLPEYAALANGIAAHGIEMDDVNNESSLHAAVTVFPTALAMADLAAVTGKSFITAVVVGYDVATRLGRALKPAAHYRRGFHPTATCGTFAAATVAARLFGLKADGIASALGIAGSQAAGNLEFLAEGAWTKRVQAGWPAHCGIWAGLLARAGYVGPATIIEGRDGFLHDYSDESDPGLVLPDLGQVFHATRTSIKPHACCRYNQGPIDCLLDLKRRYDFEVEDVKEVRVGLLTAAYNTVAVPQEEKRNPFNIVDVQFSMPFAAAVAILYGRASLAEYLPEVAQRAEVKRLMAQVQCVKDPRLDVNYPREWPAWAEVDTRDGRTLRSQVEYPKGDPQNPLTWDELKQKFLTLSAPVISSRQQHRLIAAIESLDALEDTRDLETLLAKPSGLSNPLER